MKKKIERVIWDNMDSEDFDIQEKNLRDAYCDEYPDITEDGLKDLMYEDNSRFLDDVRDNLNIKLDGDIIAIASLGLWDGRRQGYKLLKSRNIKDIFSSECDYVKWFSDGKDLKSEQHHHDGTNFITYREVKSGVNIDKLTDSIYNGETISNRRLGYYTKSIIPRIKEVYGW